MISVNFVQSTPSTTWTITHDLNNAEPNIDVFVDVLGTLTKMIPLNITANDQNTVTVTFSSNQSGQARVTA